MIFGRYRVDILGDLDYEELIADVYFDDQIVAVLTPEDGHENILITIYPSENQESWIFDLSEFEHAIQYAKQRLEELRL